MMKNDFDLHEGASIFFIFFFSFSCDESRNKFYGQNKPKSKIKASPSYSSF